MCSWRNIACDSAKNTANRHAGTRAVAFAQDVACHDFSGCCDVIEGRVALIKHLSLLVYFKSQVGEGDPWF